jgi:GntR family transcriptional regulator of vanillate catabolism
LDPIGGSRRRLSRVTRRPVLLCLGMDARYDAAMEKRMKPGQHVIVALRSMIASSELKDGERIAEIPTSEALGVSRMPVRTALRALEQEGLVVKLGARGYAARGISAGQIEGAIEVRGVLEGLAARRVAERGLGPAAKSAFKRCLATGDALFSKGHLADGDLESFYDYNLAFHDLLVDLSGNPAIMAALARNNHLPFASAAALALDWEDRAAEFRHLHAAHRQHHAVVAAILKGDGATAERLMREHASATVGSTRIFERFGIEIHAQKGKL